MFTTKWMRTGVLAAAVLAVAGVMAVLACGPAASVQQSAGGGTAVSENVSVPATEVPFVLQQSDDEGRDSGKGGSTGEPTETPTPTPYVEPTAHPSTCRTSLNWNDGTVAGTRCPPAGPVALSHPLRRMYHDHMKEQSDRRVRGQTARPEVVFVIIHTETVEAVDDVVSFLVDNGASQISSSKEGDASADGSASAHLRVSLLPSLAEIEGVMSVYEPLPQKYLSTGFQTTTTQAVAQVTQADQWHRAGFTGAGVEVAVIDDDFRDFKTRIVPLLSEPVNFLCYGANGVPKEGQLSAASVGQNGDPAGSFSACEFLNVGLPGPPPSTRPHGTNVVAALLEMAPDVKLYISNGDTPPRKSQVLSWLTKGVDDNLPTVADYNVAANDDFDVKVINHSVAEVWQGPGDGRSPFDMRDNRSLLNLVDDAVAAGPVWVNAAGNSGQGTWFKRNLTAQDFNSSERLKLNSAGDVCNPFTMVADRDYVFQMRWKGTWPRADIDMDLVLVNGSTGAEVQNVSGGDDVQSGERMHYPREVMTFNSSDVITDPTHEYCIGVRKWTRSRYPAWVQIQMYGGPNLVLGINTVNGSLNDPADSANAGMLAVGVASGGGSGDVYPHSARGPAPEPYSAGPPEEERVALDLVGLALPGGSIGTSNAAPRVAGLAALVIQALGNREGFDEPAEIARYMKWYGSTRDILDCVHDWGCGFAMLGTFARPTNVKLEAISSACPVELGSQPFRNVKLTFDPATTRNPDVPVWNYVELKRVGGADADSLVRAGITNGDSSLHRLPGDERYVAEVRTCVPGVTGPPICGVPSAPSNEVLVPRREVCKPLHFNVIPGDGLVTLVWNVQPDATGYQVERVERVDGVDVAVSGSVTTGQHFVFSGLTNRESYRFRMRVVGPSGTSPWSRVRSNSPDYSQPSAPLPSIGGVNELRPRDRFVLHSSLFGWAHDGSRALHEVRVREVGSNAWNVLPAFDHERDVEDPQLMFAYGTTTTEDGSPRVHITGLVPDTDYEVQVRGVNGDRVSVWTEMVEFTTPGRRPFDGATRPPSPAGLSVQASSVQPYPRVVLGWNASAEYYLHEVRVIGGGIDVWHRLPQQPSGWDSEYSVIYPRDGLAFITGLIPGTEYRFAVRAAKERDSSEQLDHSPWSEVVTVTMPGSRPADAPGSATAPVLKAPPMDLMAVVDGTTVDLSWTAATNPNFPHQRLLRREAGVSPVDWTEIPLALDATTYTDTGLTSGVTYRYRVRAYRSMDSGVDVGKIEEKGGFADAVIP